MGKPFGLPWDSPGKCFQLFGGVIFCRPLPREIIGTIGALEPSWVPITNDMIKNLYDFHDFDDHDDE